MRLCSLTTIILMVLCIHLSRFGHEGHEVTAVSCRSILQNLAALYDSFWSKGACRFRENYAI